MSLQRRDDILYAVGTFVAVAATLNVGRAVLSSVASKLYLRYLRRQSSTDEPDGSISALFIYPGEHIL